MHIILLLIVSLHVTCLIGSALLTYRVAIIDSSSLSIANKFYPHIGLLNGRGSLLSGEGFAEVLGDPQMIYTASSLQKDRDREAVFEAKNSADSRVIFHDGTYL